VRGGEGRGGILMEGREWEERGGDKCMFDSKDGRGGEEF
jgi:hypothetical protein